MLYFTGGAFIGFLLCTRGLFPSLRFLDGTRLWIRVLPLIVLIGSLLFIVYKNYGNVLYPPHSINIQQLVLGILFGMIARLTIGDFLTSYDYGEYTQETSKQREYPAPLSILVRVISLAALMCTAIVTPHLDRWLNNLSKLSSPWVSVEISVAETKVQDLRRLRTSQTTEISDISDENLPVKLIGTYIKRLHNVRSIMLPEYKWKNSLENTNVFVNDIMIPLAHCAAVFDYYITNRDMLYDNLKEFLLEAHKSIRQSEGGDSFAQRNKLRSFTSAAVRSALTIRRAVEELPDKSGNDRITAERIKQYKTDCDKFIIDNQHCISSNVCDPPKFINLIENPYILMWIWEYHIFLRHQEDAFRILNEYIEKFDDSIAIRFRYAYNIVFLSIDQRKKMGISVIDELKSWRRIYDLVNHTKNVMFNGSCSMHDCICDKEKYNLGDYTIKEKQDIFNLWSIIWNDYVYTIMEILAQTYDVHMIEELSAELQHLLQLSREALEDNWGRGIGSLCFKNIDTAFLPALLDTYGFGRFMLISRKNLRETNEYDSIIKVVERALNISNYEKNRRNLSDDELKQLFNSEEYIKEHRQIIMRYFGR